MVENHGFAKVISPPYWFFFPAGMKIINWYILKNMLVTLGMTIGVLVFVMLSTHFYRAFNLLANGLAPGLMVKMIGMFLPDVLRYALPLSMLVATVLVFNRMSADDEIIALKASGVSIWQIVAPVLVLGIILSGVGLWLGLSIAPEWRFKSQQIDWQAKSISSNPLAMLEPGATIRFSANRSLRIGGIDPSGQLKDIHIYDLDTKGEVLRDITANSGVVNIFAAQRQVEVILSGFTISQLDHSANDKSAPPLFITGDRIIIPDVLGIQENSKPSDRKLNRKLKMMDAMTLLGDLQLKRTRGESVTDHWLELQKRLALAFSPLAFLLLGIPFGIRQKRSGTSAGISLCVVIALIFYGFMLLADALADYPRLHPEFIIWIPNLLAQIGGLWALARLSRN